MSLFGAPQQPATGGGLFGGTAATAPKPMFGGFGQPAAAQQPAAAAAPLFGGFGAQQQQQTQQQQQPANPFGGFGAQPQQQQQQQQPAATGFGGFGAPTATPAPAAGAFGGFGAQPQQQQQQQQQPYGYYAGTIGAQPQQQAYGYYAAGTTGFGGFGAAPAAPQQSNQQSTTFTRSTKFNDLPPNVKNLLEQMDRYIQERIHMSKELAQRAQTQRATDTQQPIRAVNREVVDVGSGIDSDVAIARHLREQVDRSNTDLVLAIRIIDGHKNNATAGVHLKNHASFPHEYFQREAEDLKDKLTWCKTTMEQIERKLASTARPAGQQAAITHTISAQHQTFMNLASHVAVLHTEIEKLKAAYTGLWRARMGAAFDPFQDAH